MEEGEKRRMKGMRVRDEFVCPITCELFREPVVASDGHSYEKLAIEKWLTSRSTSPRTGKKMGRYLTPNLNLQKLIHDMIAEGGHSLYTNDSSDTNRLFYVKAEKTLVMTCLGPSESKWNMQAFDVSQMGCLGGRHVLEEASEHPRELVIFEDSTVSRTHFEIVFDGVGQHYTIRDLGSAGGTFIRVPYGKKKEIIPGTMFLLGKHQFKVTGKVILQSSHAKECSETEYKQSSKQSESSSSLEDIVGDAEALLVAIEELSLSSEDKRHQTSLIKSQMERLKQAASSLSPPAAKVDHRFENKRCLNAEKKTSDLEDAESNSQDKDLGYGDNAIEIVCFGPEGSPLLGNKYTVGQEGASIGRSNHNDIAFSSEDQIFDSSVSQEHARIEMDKESGSFFLCDGSLSKPSTNGTWYRLSSPQQKSSPHELKPGQEVLIGTVRFQASERMMIKEESIE